MQKKGIKLGNFLFNKCGVKKNAIWPYPYIWITTSMSVSIKNLFEPFVS